MSQVISTARELLSEADNDVAAAKELLRSKVPELLAALGTALVTEAVERAIDDEWRSSRHQYWKRPTVLNTGELSEPGRLLRGGLALKLDYPMAHGRMLRDFTKAECEETAVLWLAQGESLIVRAKWLTLIAKELKKNTDKVGDHLQECDLERLQRRASKAA